MKPIVSSAVGLQGTGSLAGSAQVLGKAAMQTSLSQRLRDFVVLSKPRIALMSLLVVAAGYGLGLAEGFVAASLTHALIGIGLVAVASSVLNQVVEVDTDSRMRRTMNRPLPAGRISRVEATVFGVVVGLIGAGWLAAFVNTQTVIAAIATLVLYVGVYTPLKRRSSLATSVGSLPGAMPVVLGWLAAGRPLDVSAFVLFGIMVLWQFPHFLAIAWMYKDDYARAGLRMLPTGPQIPRVTGTVALAYAVALIPVSVAPAMCGLAGRWYLAGALLLSVWYAIASLRFAMVEDHTRARSLLRTSLLYLPGLLALMVWDHFRLLA